MLESQIAPETMGGLPIDSEWVCSILPDVEGSAAWATRGLFQHR